jgi:pentatricopeptide repeat protein
MRWIQREYYLNTVTCNIIVDALCKMGEADKAEKLLSHMLVKGAGKIRLEFSRI